MSKSSKSTPPDKAADLMYMGPTIAGVIRHSTVLKDGVLPERAKACISEYPAMKRLFVSLDDLPDASRELAKKQSALRTIYHQTEQKYVRRD